MVTREHNQRPMDDSTSLPRVLPTPTEMVAHLDRYVRGQQQAKRDLATAVYNHYVGLAAGEEPGKRGRRSAPQHVLMLGPTGTGKTLLVQTLAALLDVPYTYASATSLVQTGYVGTPVESVVLNLLARANGDVFKAERGMIFIDEIDKVRCWGPSSGPDVSGEGVQMGLLTLLDGRKVSKTNPNGAASPEVDSSRILFVCAGAFVGLEEIVAKRHGSGSIGLRPLGTTAGGNAPADFDVQDLVSFGFIPELLGRFAAFTVLHALQADDLVHILTDAEDSALRRKRAFWALHGIELEFSQDALQAIAHRALQFGTGARGLNHIVERCLDDVDWRPVELAQQGVTRIVVNADTVRTGAPPFLVQGSPRDLGPLPITDLRRRALRPTTPGGGLGAPGTPAISDTREWDVARIREAIEASKNEHLGWKTTTGSARKWWEAFEAENQHRLGLILRLAEELAVRKATITEFFLAYVYSNTDNIQANLHYLDYVRLKKEEERKRKGSGGTPPSSL